MKNIVLAFDKKKNSKSLPEKGTDVEEKSLLDTNINEEENLSSDTDDEKDKKMTGKKTKRKNFGGRAKGIRA